MMLLKYSALPSEIEEGVAFYGRAGGALMKSLKRLSIDPLAVYGTLCVKCPLSDTSLAEEACMARVVEEIAIVQPKIVVTMGAEALRALNEMNVPLGRPLEERIGEIQKLTPTIDALYVPDIDESLDEQEQSESSGRPSAHSATGTPHSRPTEGTRSGLHPTGEASPANGRVWPRHRTDAARRRYGMVRTILPSLPPAAKRS